ncbi:hypothetical protein BDV34DRAFT_231871 [Aspergillus parasiticus]|uniref:Uncharacterized protein n=1 Tax=Aspergillus parasiticus TaxID=5067 RepID=A0A5N6E4B5_ASPPA|nr:hypothetical protein BDV34DRAFT_231871 [Aspergillus parasiticus]
MTSWNIKPCSVADAPALAYNNRSAFWLSNVRSATRISYYAHDRKSVTRRLSTLLLAILSDMPDGFCLLPTLLQKTEVHSGLDAQVPDVSYDEKRKFQQLAESAWWNGRSDMRSIDDKSDAVTDHIVAQRPSIKLDYLAVHPRNKDERIATSLVASGIRVAESIDVPIVTMTCKAGRGVYTRLGLKEIDRVIQDDSKYGGAGGYEAYFMIYVVNT